MSTRLTEVFSKTKILCTLGPSTYTTEDIEKLILAGMDGVRLNFSHGDYDFYEKVFQNIYNACVEEKTFFSRHNERWGATPLLRRRAPVFQNLPIPDRDP